MKVLVTGGTGYLGRAVVSALAARGHELVIFARSASRSGLPGTADRRRHPRSRGARARRRAAATRSRIPPRSSASGGAGREDFDDVNVGGLRNVLAAAAALGTPRVLYTSSFVALPPRGRTEPLARQRLSAHEGRRRSRRRRGGPRRQPADARLPGRGLRAGLVHRGQPGRPADRRSSEAQAARPRRPGAPLVVRLRRRCRGRTLRGARARTRRRTLRARRRERAAAPRLRDRAAAHRTAAAAAHSVSGRRRCSAPPRSCASRCSAARR